MGVPETVAGQGFSGSYPPDPVGDVGKAYYIQMINANKGSVFTVHDKQDGSVVAGPIGLYSLGTGTCANGLGDPVVLYDSLAERWLLSEFSSSNNTLCVYVSQTADPVSGGWYAYQFVSKVSFPDYPKYAVWSDAYYLTTNENAPGIYALDRDAMLRGDPASMQYFTVASLAGFEFQALTPADVDGGVAPPVGRPGLVARHRDDEAHDPGNNDPTRDQLELFEVWLDWQDESQSHITGPLVLPMAEFDSDVCGYNSFSCFPQPGTSKRLDPVREIIMWRLAYRNQGDRETLVGNFTVDVDGADHGGIRWFELQRSDGDWNLLQEGTHAPDAQHRWMGSIAQDIKGNMALGYSVSSESLFPSLRYAGRERADPPGVLSQTEQQLIAGEGSQVSNRWGDYSAMSIDPLDGCTFWFTGPYAPTGGRWATHIGHFRFDNCADPDFLLVLPNGTRPILCPAATSQQPVELVPVAGYAETVDLSLADLPAGLNAQVLPATPDGKSILEFTPAAELVAGEYGLTLIADDGKGLRQERLLRPRLLASSPAAPQGLSPAERNGVLPVDPRLSWQVQPDVERYEVELSLRPDFSVLEFSGGTRLDHLSLPFDLAGDTTYHWRVRALSPCGVGPWQTTSFVTRRLYCSTDLRAIPDNDTMGVTSELQITDEGVLADLAVSLDLDHTWVGDLEIRLERVADGMQRTLLDRPGLAGNDASCSGQDIAAVLLDQAEMAADDRCDALAPSIAGELRPTQSLSPLVGGAQQGSWRLHLIDHAADDIGSLTHWCLLPQTLGDCDGDLVTLTDQTIAAGDERWCNVGRMELQNLTLQGTLHVRYGQSVRLLQGVRVQQGRLQVLPAN